MGLRILKVLPKAAALTLLIVGFQNCGNARFTQDEGPAPLTALDGDASYVHDTTTNTTTNTPSDTAGNPSNPVKIPNNDDVAYSGACSIFKDTPILTQIPANAVDIDASRSSSPVSIEFAKNLLLQADSSTVFVRAAESATLDRLSGSLTQVSAVQVPSATRVSGALCLRAEHIGLISQLSAGSKVIANTIEEVYQNSATLHIYGAVVKKVWKSSGKICLHDGARVLDQSDNSAAIVIGDCK